MITITQHKITRAEQHEIFRIQNQCTFNELTPREQEILGLVASGYNNLNIANVLCISRHTVEQHRKNMYRKLSISSVHELYQYALAFDLI